MKDNRPILLVEDDRVDVMTVKRAIRDLEIKNPLGVAGNGIEALEWLRDNNPMPLFILLDVHMPRMNGIELLEHLKADEHLRLIPVIMLTTSAEQRDRMASYNLSVAGYMRKPVSYDDFREIIRNIYTYWSTCEHPDNPGLS